MSTGYIIGDWVGKVISAGILSVINAMALRPATTWFCKFRPSYMIAYEACVSLAIAQTIIWEFFVRYDGSVTAARVIAFAVCSVPLGGLLYSMTIKNANSTYIGFRQGCLLSLIMLPVNALVVSAPLLLCLLVAWVVG